MQAKDTVASRSAGTFASKRPPSLVFAGQKTCGPKTRGSKARGPKARDPKAHSGKSRGFSLLEILVAFTILVLAMGILMQIFSRGVNNAGLADLYAKATILAESKLATVGIEAPLQDGNSTGQFELGGSDRFQWQLQIGPYVDTTPKAPPVNANGSANANSINSVLSATSTVDIESLMSVRLYDVSLTVRFQSV